MLTVRELKSIANARLADARALLSARRYDSVIYLCGYAVKIGLKRRICKALNWSVFPSTSKEFEGLQSFKTHDLARLLQLSSVEARITTRYQAEWSIVRVWDPEARYNPIGRQSRQDAEQMVEATRVLLKAL